MKGIAMNDTYHFIGIGGIGMSGLARLLLSQSIKVTGSDIAFNAVIEELIKEGATIHKGQSPENVLPHAKVVYTSDIKADNPEYQAAKEMQCALLHRADLLAELLQGYKALAIAGTHGKTTTSSLLATVLVDAGIDPSFAIGGMLPAFQSNARFGRGEYFAFEADESDRSFLKYQPFGAIVTNIDNDHLNNYNGSFDSLIEHFKLFMSQVQSSRHLFWCRDDQYLTALHFSGQSYGFHPDSDWKIISMQQDGFRMYFDLEHQKELYSKIEVALVGRHNVLNAAAAFGLARTLGVPEASIRQSFKTFKGVLRRCENKGSCHGVHFLDDYAHHPTEIQTTLQGLRQAVGPKRLIAVFQAHRYTRTQDCLGAYGTIFDAADELIITDIYAAGENPIPNLSHACIQQEVEQNSTIPCQYISRPALSHFLSQFVQPFDVVVTLGAGDITKLSSETLGLLEKMPQRLIKVGVIWDDETFAECKQAWQTKSFPYLDFCELVLTKNFKWLSQDQIRQEISLNQSKEHNIVLPSIKQLLECDVCLSLLSSQKESSIQGFLDILGKPYVKEARTKWMIEKQNLEHLILIALQEKRSKDRS
jgi:UDP-N-acetylmuramate--alanine ligase